MKKSSIIKSLAAGLVLAGFVASPLHAATLRVSEDSNTQEAVATDNVGKNQLLQVSNNVLNYQRDGYVKFDLSVLPAELLPGEILKATLRLWPRVIQVPGTIDLHEVSGPWTEVVVNWNNAPAIDPLPFDSVTISADDRDTFVTADITDLVTAWVSGSVSNNGIAIVGSGADPMNIRFQAQEGEWEGNGAEIEVVIESNSSTMCPPGEILTGGAGCSPVVVDTDTHLTEADVDSFVDNNGYLTSFTEIDPSVPANIKDGVSWTELSDRPAGLDDGDDVGITSEGDPKVASTLGNMIPKWNGASLIDSSIYDNGFVGIGTTNPGANLETSGEGARVANVVTAYGGDGTSPVYSVFLGKRARGTYASPSAVQSGDILTFFGSKGYVDGSYNDNGWPSVSSVGMSFLATENHTDTAQGTKMVFMTTPNGEAAKKIRMTISESGNVGIGSSNPLSKLVVVDNSETKVVIKTYSDSETAALVGLRARGTSASPSAVQDGDVLFGIYANGYGPTGNDFSSAAQILFNATENWTDTNQGAEIKFRTQSNGTNTRATRMSISNNGNVGIGTLSPARKLHISDAMRLEPLSNSPESPSSGDMYFDSSEALCVFVDNAWTKIAGSGYCANSIVGSWGPGLNPLPGVQYATHTYYPNGYYIFWQSLNGGEVEYGTYSYNETTKVMTHAAFYDDNPSAGPTSSEGNTAVITVTGDTMDIDGEITWERVQDVSSPIVGGWAEGHNAAISRFMSITFYPNGYYIDFETDDLMDACDNGGGVEYGTYVYNPTTEILTVTPIVDENGCVGPSPDGQPAILDMKVVGNNLVVFEEDAVENIFSRVNYGSVGSP